MLWKKACRRCAGDVYLQTDFHGQFFTCIQCGALVDHSVPVPLVSAAERCERRATGRVRARSRALRVT